jgi:3',5'-cyclic AMP phosphodiesterase CpdA
MLFSRGNHDVRGPGARHLQAYFPKSLGSGYQNLLRIGPVAIIVLDTGEDKEGPQIYGDLGEWALYREAQKGWLENAVRDPLFKKAPHRIVFCHIPLRWKSPQHSGDWCQDGDNRWSPVLAKAGVSAVISGHTHEFWCDSPNAARPFYQIVGGGPQTQSTDWSPTPATVTLIEADQTALTIRVIEADSWKVLVSVRTNPHSHSHSA